MNDRNLTASILFAKAMTPATRYVVPLLCLSAATVAMPAIAFRIVFADPPLQQDRNTQQAKKRQTRSKAFDHPELVAVEQRLRTLVVNDGPSADLRLIEEDKQVVATYHTRDFQVYTIFKNGKIADQPHSERGPEHDGFLLRVTWQPGEYHGPAVISQDVRHPYWTTYINAVRVPEKAAYLWIQLSYGSRTDRKVLEALKTAAGVQSAGKE